MAQNPWSWLMKKLKQRKYPERSKQTSESNKEDPMQSEGKPLGHIANIKLDVHQQADQNQRVVSSAGDGGKILDEKPKDRPKLAMLRKRIKFFPKLAAIYEVGKDNGEPKKCSSLIVDEPNVEAKKSSRQIKEKEEPKKSISLIEDEPKKCSTLIVAEPNVETKGSRQIKDEQKKCSKPTVNDPKECNKPKVDELKKCSRPVEDEQKVEPTMPLQKAQTLGAYYALQKAQIMGAYYAKQKAQTLGDKPKLQKKKHHLACFWRKEDITPFETEGLKPFVPTKRRPPKPSIPPTAAFLGYHRRSHACRREKNKFTPKLEVIHEDDETKEYDAETIIRRLPTTFDESFFKKERLNREIFLKYGYWPDDDLYYMIEHECKPQKEPVVFKHQYTYEYVKWQEARKNQSEPSVFEKKFKRMKKMFQK